MLNRARAFVILVVCLVAFGGVVEIFVFYGIGISFVRENNVVIFIYYSYGVRHCVYEVLEQNFFFFYGVNVSFYVD